jgi:hypothetical protein
MEYLKTFESFGSFENAKVDKTTIKFIDGSITESQFTDYLNADVFNEGIMDDIKGFISNMKTKFVDVLYTFLKKAAENGMIVFNSFKSLINWILDSLSNWKKENPKLFKAIVLTAMVMILLMVSAGAAHAQSQGTDIPVAHLDAAIGYLEKLKGASGEDNLQLMKSMAYLIDMRDGVQDIPVDVLAKSNIAAANSAIKTTGDMLNDAVVSKDKEALQRCYDLMEAGMKYINYVIAKGSSASGSAESVKLVVK